MTREIGDKSLFFLAGSDRVRRVNSGRGVATNEPPALTIVEPEEEVRMAARPLYAPVESAQVSREGLAL